MRKIYFNNNPLFVTDKITRDLEEQMHMPDTIFIDEMSNQAVRTMIYEMEQPEIYRGIFLCSDVGRAIELFKNELTPVYAAGGFVYSPANSILFIYRRGKWDLPKGKQDEGEDLQTCAVREVAEETGLKGAEVERELCTTYHTYRERGLHILKETHWFVMHAASELALSAQHEEDIEICEWGNVDSLGKYLGNTHASITDVIRAGAALLGRPLSE